VLKKAQNKLITQKHVVEELGLTERRIRRRCCRQRSFAPASAAASLPAAWARCSGRVPTTTRRLVKLKETGDGAVIHGLRGDRPTGG